MATAKPCLTCVAVFPSISVVVCFSVHRLAAKICVLFYYLRWLRPGLWMCSVVFGIYKYRGHIHFLCCPGAAVGWGAKLCVSVALRNVGHFSCSRKSLLLSGRVLSVWLGLFAPILVATCVPFFCIFCDVCHLSLVVDRPVFPLFWLTICSRDRAILHMLRIFDVLCDSVDFLNGTPVSGGTSLGLPRRWLRKRSF